MPAMPPCGAGHREGARPARPGPELHASPLTSSTHTLCLDPLLFGVTLSGRGPSWVCACEWGGPPWDTPVCPGLLPGAPVGPLIPANPDLPDVLVTPLLEDFKDLVTGAGPLSSAVKKGGE